MSSMEWFLDELCFKLEEDLVDSEMMTQSKLTQWLVENVLKRSKAPMLTLILTHHLIEDLALILQACDLDWNHRTSLFLTVSTVVERLQQPGRVALLRIRSYWFQATHILAVSQRSY